MKFPVNHWRYKRRKIQGHDDSRQKCNSPKLAGRTPSLIIQTSDYRDSERLSGAWEAHAMASSLVSAMPSNKPLDLTRHWESSRKHESSPLVSLGPYVPRTAVLFTKGKHPGFTFYPNFHSHFRRCSLVNPDFGGKKLQSKALCSLSPSMKMNVSQHGCFE